MTRRSENPTSRDNLYRSAYGAANKLLAVLPVTPLDVAIAFLGTGLAFLCDRKVVDRETGRQILVDALSQFDASAGDPEATAH